MSNYATKQDVEEVVGKNVGEVLEVLRTFMQQVDMRFEHVDTQLNIIETRMDEFDKKIDRLTNTMDNFIGRLDQQEIETAA